MYFSLKAYRPGFPRPGSFRKNRLTNRPEGQESYSRLLAPRPRRFSQSTFATTVSGRSTPDNRSIVSMDESSYNGSFYEQPSNPFGRDNTLSQLTPSEYGSAFSRPTSVFSNSGHGSRFGVYPPRLPETMKDGRSETDEELSQYGWEDSSSSNQWDRRPSLPLHHRHRPNSRQWDFKHRTRSSFKTPKKIGRVSPFTPSNLPPFSSSPPFLEPAASKHSPPSPMKDQLILLEVSESQNPNQSTQESTDNEATNSELMESQQSPDENHDPTTDNHGEELEEKNESQSAGVTPLSPSLHSASPVPIKDPPEWPPENDDTLPAYEVEDTHNQEANVSPTPYTTVKVLNSTLDPSPPGSLSRKTPRISFNSDSSTHPVDLVNRGSPPHPSPNRTDFPRRTSAPETSIAMRPKHTSTEPKSHSTSSFEPMQNYKRAIHKANEFERAMRALAESGSSDQDSDSEPYGENPEGVTVSEHKKIQEKMRATNSDNQFKIHQLSLKRKPGASFGFSLADGCYDPGIFVKAVKEGSPADKSGLLPYDKVVKVSQESHHIYNSDN